MDIGVEMVESELYEEGSWPAMEGVEEPFSGQLRLDGGVEEISSGVTSTALMDVGSESIEEGICVDDNGEPLDAGRV